MSYVNRDNVKVLKDARDLISDRRRWTQGQYAVSRDGKSVFISPANKDAYAFCSIGACLRVGGYVPSYLEHAAKNRGYFQLWEANDSMKHAEVLEMFDEAIRLAEHSCE